MIRSEIKKSFTLPFFNKFLIIRSGDRGGSLGGRGGKMMRYDDRRRGPPPQMPKVKLSFITIVRIGGGGIITLSSQIWTFVITGPIYWKTFHHIW